MSRGLSWSEGELTGAEGPLPVRSEGALAPCMATIPANPAALAITAAGARLILRSSWSWLRGLVSAGYVRSQGVDLEVERVLGDPEPQGGRDDPIDKSLGSRHIDVPIRQVRHELGKAVDPHVRARADELVNPTFTVPDKLGHFRCQGQLLGARSAEDHDRVAVPGQVLEQGTDGRDTYAPGDERYLRPATGMGGEGTVRPFDGDTGAGCNLATAEE